MSKGTIQGAAPQSLNRGDVALNQIATGNGINVWGANNNVTINSDAMITRFLDIIEMMQATESRLLQQVERLEARLLELEGKQNE